MPALPGLLPTLVFIGAFTITAGPADARAQGETSREQDAKIPLRLLFVGTQREKIGATPSRVARTREFAEFLGSQFEDVRVADRDGFDPASADDADVVLLDWSQQEVDLAKMSELTSPLGPRDEWEHPTVLLGSAGLLLGMPWELKGGYG